MLLTHFNIQLVLSMSLMRHSSSHPQLPLLRLHSSRVVARGTSMPWHRLLQFLQPIFTPLQLLFNLRNRLPRSQLQFSQPISTPLQLLFSLRNRLTRSQILLHPHSRLLLRPLWQLLLLMLPHVCLFTLQRSDQDWGDSWRWYEHRWGACVLGVMWRWRDRE